MWPNCFFLKTNRNNLKNNLKKYTLSIAAYLQLCSFFMTSTKKEPSRTGLEIKPLLLQNTCWRGRQHT